MPILAVAFGAIPAAWIVAQFGLRIAIVGGISVMVLASVARGETKALGGCSLPIMLRHCWPHFGSFQTNWIGLRDSIAVSAVLSAIGIAGFIFLDAWASWAFALVACFAATVELILLVSLPVTIASGIAVTRLSAGMTLIGFAIAFILPLIGGWLTDRAQIIEMTLIPSLIFIIVEIPILVLATTSPAPSRASRYADYRRRF